jgi:adenosylcobinamide-GDP ribazoletransferase
VLALLSKVAVLALIAQAGGAAVAAVALFAGHVTSRLMPLFVIHTLPHVGDTPLSKSKPLADSLSRGALLVGVVWWALAMALSVALLPDVGWAQAVLGALLALLWMWRLLRRRLQGFTGDGLGATQQVSEIAFLLALSASLPMGVP